MSYKNVEGLLNVNNLEKTSDSELAAWADNLFDRSLNWKVGFLGSCKESNFSNFSSRRRNMVQCVDNMS
jgi:hypothetical protein